MIDKSTQIQTKRLALRKPTEEDSRAWFGMIQGHKKDLADTFPVTLNACKTASLTTSYIQNLDKKWEEGSLLVFGIYFVEQLIGFCMAKNIDWRVPKAELAYFITREQRRNGYAQEALSAMMEYLERKHRFVRFYARIAPFNVASQIVVERLNFKKEGTMSKDFRSMSGELMDVHCFGRTV